MAFLRRAKFIIFLISFLQRTSSEKLWVQRNPKYLPFPMGLGNKLQIIAGFGVPVQLKEDSLTFGLIIKTNFVLPTNASQFTNPDEAFADFSKKKIRWSLYDVLVSIFDRLSMGGRDCMLRSICEAAFTPLSHNGLLGEILHVILAPSSTKDEIPGYSDDYMKAELIGKESPHDKHCAKVFPDCSHSLLDIISILENLPFQKDDLHKLDWL